MSLSYSEKVELNNLKKSIYRASVWREEMEKYRQFVNYHNKSKNKNKLFAPTKK